jgi:multisubunit Na+/H+ antiporter MnhG subunit
MGRDDGLSKDRVVVEATRRALRDDLRRAYANSVLGATMVAFGAGLTFGVLGVRLFTSSTFGMMVTPFGVAVLARAVYTIATSWRRLRDPDGRTSLARKRIV